MEPVVTQPSRSGIPWFMGLVCLLAGAASVVSYQFVSRPKNNPAPAPTPIRESASVTPFQLVPPSRSLTGTLSAATGRVTILTRTSDAFETATPGSSIRIGESVATGADGTAQITIPPVASLAMQEGAEISFANLYPENTVLLQKAGKVFYTVESDHPVAVRALHTLVSASSSAFFVNVIDTDMSVTAQSGAVVFALVDLNNETHVYTIEDGQRANIDDAGRTVNILSPR